LLTVGVTATVCVLSPAGAAYSQGVTDARAARSRGVKNARTVPPATA
jgi:hypothetical protein